MNSRTSSSPQFWILAVFLVIVFLFGGASRIDALSMAVVRPASIIACALALLTIRREHVSRFSVPVLMMAGILLLCVAHLIPLPPAIWHALPGRELLVEIDHATGLGDVWRPLTITPLNGQHSLLHLLTPLAVLLLGVQLSREDLYRLLWVFIGMAVLSGLLGILQVIGSRNGPLYFYRITNNGSAVGLFANRNHAAALLACLFPMVATMASLGQPDGAAQRMRQVAALGILVVNVPLLLVTGSRSGFAIGLLGLAVSAVLYRRLGTDDRGPKARRRRFARTPVVGAATIGAMALLTVLFSRAEVFARLFGGQAGEETRGQFWVATVQLVRDYFPWGSGTGSFVEAYEIREGVTTLSPQYVNHAHNDWLEIVLTTGLPGALLLAAAVIFAALQVFAVWRRVDRDRREVKFARLGSVLIVMLGLASITDYPLRTPALASLLAVGALWLFAARAGDTPRQEAA